VTLYWLFVSRCFVDLETSRNKCRRGGATHARERWPAGAATGGAGAARGNRMRIMPPLFTPKLARAHSRKPHSRLQASRRQPARSAMTELPHVLVVEDDHEIRRLVAGYLGANEYRVSVAGDGREMERVLAASRIDLIVLDLMLPGEEGLSLCLRLREHSRMPIIMLTAKGDEIDRILGLEMGADDYLAKPFNPRELLARIRAVLRRGASAAEAQLVGAARTLSFLGWRLDCVRRELRSPQGARVAVTEAELDLLQVLCERRGRVLSRRALVELTRGRAIGPFERSIDILISRLRRKIEADPHHPDIIKTVRAGGYMLTPMVEAS
jgi:two-component system, OmpR family, response regulator